MLAKPERSGRGDFTCQPLDVGGADLVADRSGALWWPAERALVVADLHLEKGSSGAARGRLLPPYDTRATLIKLAGALQRYRPRTVIALGDSLHDPDGARRITREDREVLAGFQRRRDWIWVTGNHDPVIDAALGGRSAEEITLAGIVLRHIPQPGGDAPEIAGHMHPAALLAARGARLRRACFIGSCSRLVLPAFGVLTGGLNVLDDAFLPLFRPSQFAVWLLGSEGLYPVSIRQLCAETAARRYG